MPLKSSSLISRLLRGQFPGRLAIAAATPLLLAGTVFAQIVPPPTIVRFPWDWHIEVVPIGTTTPLPIGLWGTARVDMGQPQNVGNPSAPPTFDIGPGGTGTNFPSNEAPPLGGTYQIPIELVELNLTSMMPVMFPAGPPTDVIIRQDPTRRSLGMIQNMQNLGDGTMQVDSFFDIFVEIDLPQLGMTLRNDEPMRAGMSFGNVPNPNPEFGPPGLPLGVLDTPWIPTWIWREVFVNSPFWRDFTGAPWDHWVSIHGHVTVPEPNSLGLLFVAMVVTGMGGARRRSR